MDDQVRSRKEVSKIEPRAARGLTDRPDNGGTRLRIWGSGVRISPGAPIKSGISTKRRANRTAITRDPKQAGPAGWDEGGAPSGPGKTLTLRGSLARSAGSAWTPWSYLVKRPSAGL